MDIDSIRLFALAADMLNISAAGRTLGLAPSVASARLAKLETEIGADLLHRSTRKVSLSLEGANFLPYAREIIAQEDMAKSALGLGSPVVSGTIRFAAPSSFAQIYICPLIPKFLSQNPNLNLDLRLSDSQFDLIDGSFDLALRNVEITNSSLMGRKLADDVRILCASPSYLNEYGVPINIDEMKNHQVISFRNSTPKTLVSSSGETAILKTDGNGKTIIIDDGLSYKVTTQAGAGISINSVWSVASAMKDGSLIRVLPNYVLADKTALWLIYPKSNVLTGKVRVLIDFLVDEIKKPLIALNKQYAQAHSL